MTVGSDIADYRVTMNLSSGPNQKVGTYWKRVWSGADQTTIPKPSNIFSDYFSRINAGVLDADPSAPISATFVRRKWDRPPKRARRDEHAYSMTLESSFNPLFKYGSPGPTAPTLTTSWEGAVGLYVVSIPWVSNDDIALLNKLREKVAGSDFNAAVSLAEAHQSLVLIATGAQRIAGAIKAVKRGDFRAASKALSGPGNGRKIVARNWLELQYGVKPLLNDVYNAAQSLAHFTGTPVRMTHTVYRSVRGTVTTQSQSTVRWSTASASKAVKIKAIISEVNIPSLFGLTDPASVLWEKLPYSFVVDWFVPIGNYLAARGLAQSITGTFVTSTITRMQCANPARTAFGESVQQWTDEYKSTRYRTVQLDRTISTTLSVKMPGIKPLSKWASWTHAANAVALLSQLKR